MRNMKNRYTAMFAVLPILSMYATPIPGITLGELFLLLFWVEYVVLFAKNKITIERRHPQNLLIFFSLYAMISSFVSYGCSASTLDVVIRSIRFSFYYFTAVILSRKLVNKEKTDRFFYNVSVFSIAFLLLQYGAYYLRDIVLRGVMPGLTLYLTDYDAINYDAIYASSFFRPTSVFLEPAHFCQYIFIALAIALFRKNNIVMGLLFTVSLILSTSVQGILIGAAIWSYFVFCKLKQKNISRKYIIRGILGLLLVLPVMYMLMKSSIFEKSIGRLLVVGEKSAVAGRLGVYEVLFEEWNLFTLIFGHGFGSVIEGEWMPGLAYVQYGTGFIGTGLIGLYVWKSWKRGSAFNRCMIIVFLLTFVQASIFMNVLAILYIYFIGSYERS